MQVQFSVVKKGELKMSNFENTIKIDQCNHEIAIGLSLLLSDTYTLYLKTHKFHWNVTGIMFPVLHGVFQSQYLDLALAVDLIAERIRTKGVKAPGSYSEYLKLSTIKDSIKDRSSHQMIEDLLIDQATVILTAKNLVGIASECKDLATIDLLSKRIESHEKYSWMLRSMIES